MDSNTGKFWDTRFRNEGPIWGEAPSPTALLAARYAESGVRVLEVGFGYGRDLVFLGRQKCRVSGIDLSNIGRQLAEERLKQNGICPEGLWTGLFEDYDIPLMTYDLVVCHRLAHLLLTADAVARFADRVEEVLRPEGVLCLGVRNHRDLNPAEMNQVGDDIYEYIKRPGHCIRYWENGTFQRAFGKAFSILTLVSTVENETITHPVPCHLTVMVARKSAVARFA